MATQLISFRSPLLAAILSAVIVPTCLSIPLSGVGGGGGKGFSECLELVTVGVDDTCESIARRFQFPKGAFDLVALNPGLNCATNLPIGAGLCVKTSSPHNQESTKPRDVPNRVPSNCAKAVTVAKGDTCFALALQYNTKGLVDGLKALNPDIDCNDLAIDSVLCVRVGDLIPCGRWIVVQRGDTCFDLAKEFQLENWQELERLNGWTGNDVGCFGLQVGQNICVKAPERERTRIIV
jgi:hypothetical protein